MKLHDISPLALVVLSVLTGAFGARVGGESLYSPLTANGYVKDIQTLRRESGFPKTSIYEQTKQLTSKEKMPTYSAKSILLVDIATDSILTEDRSAEIIALASITKLATVLTFLELNIPHDMKITIIPSDVIDSRSGLSIGDVISVKDLLGLTLVGSSNSAAKTLQRVSGISMEYFVGRMNMLGRRIGLTHASFVEPTGLSSKNVGTAYDVYRLLMESSRNETIRSFANSSSYEFFNGKEYKQIAATDALTNGQIQFSGKNLIVAKTGYIPEAGFHVALLAIDSNNNERAVIVLGAKDTLARFTEANSLLFWGTSFK